MKGDCCTGMTSTPWGPFAPDYSFYCYYYFPSSLLSCCQTCCWSRVYHRGDLKEHCRHHFFSLRRIPITIQFQTQISWGLCRSLLVPLYSVDFICNVLHLRLLRRTNFLRIKVTHFFSNVSWRCYKYIVGMINRFVPSPTEV